jgi:hypothetical protein
MATDKQIAFITALAAKAGHASNVDAINAYGLGLRTARDLSVVEASEMIDFLTGKPHHASIAPAAAAPKAAKVVNKAGRVGMTVAFRGIGVGTVVSDAGKRVQIRFADGSKAGYDAAGLIFTA